MDYKCTQLIATGLLALVLCCVSCRSNRNEQNISDPEAENLITPPTETEAGNGAKTLSFSSYREKKKVSVGNNPQYPFCDIDINMVYPSGFYDKGKLKKIQDIFLANTLGESYAGLPPTQAGQLYVQKYIEDYQEEMQGYIDELKKKGEPFDPENEEWMNYTLSLSTNTLFDSHSIWSYGCQTYTYTGGAHGMSGTVYQSIDTETVHAILLSDIFAEKETALLTALLKRELMKKEGVGTEEGLTEKGFWPENLSPTENFYVDQKGITWLYNPYEIAPYALGTIRITLSYDQTAPYILPDCPVRRLFE